jgi:hypothetical protein
VQVNLQSFLFHMRSDGLTVALVSGILAVLVFDFLLASLAAPLARHPRFTS